MEPHTPGTSNNFLQMYGHELQQTDFWYHTSFHHIRMGLFAMISYKKTFPKLLQYVDLQTRINSESCIIALHHIFFLHFENS